MGEISKGYIVAKAMKQEKAVKFLKFEYRLLINALDFLLHLTNLQCNPHVLYDCIL